MLRGNFMLDTNSATKMGRVLLGAEKDTDDLDITRINAIGRIRIASPEEILQWSRRHCRQTDKRGVCKCGKSADEQSKCTFGEVKKPETINYRTFKPEKDGLFCERIFGPVKDWECSCGKYKRIKYKGIICDRCGVEVTESKVRRRRMGHIKLAASVSHIWFYKGTSSRISNLLDVSVRNLGKVLYFQDYIVVDPGDAPLKEKQILSEEEYMKYKEIYGNRVKIGIGAESIKELLKKLDINDLANSLAIEMRQATSAQARMKIIKRLKVVDAFRNSGNNPEWMVLECLPVIPPDLRPLVHLDGGRFATSDLNDLYRRVINRNNRLKRLIELNAPDVILRNEKRMLQESVDALFDNSRRARPTKGHNNRPLKSLSDILKGKQGRFRQNLLGKRVDYSGRSVIVVGPELKFNQCGLPKKMALELFDPFIIRELQIRGYVNTIKSAKRMMEREDPIVYDILVDIIKDHPVLLNRAPTLHRLGVQGFMPKLIEGKAIQLHPLSCAAFNADFDGDQMAVHVPLSTESKLEAKHLILAQNNILTPANGEPKATPSQDIVIGLYYLTKPKTGVKGEGKSFASIDEVLLAYESKKVDLHAKINIRVDGKMVKTTVGRAIFSEVLPSGISFFNEEYAFSNETLTNKKLKEIVAFVYRITGNTKTAEMLDKMMKLGFEYAKRSGVSFAVSDMIVPDEKGKIISSSFSKVEKVQKDYLKGVITNGERYNKVIDIWTHATEDVAEAMKECLRKDKDGFNSLFMMQGSGARGSEQQVRQLAGMRGLMQKPTKKVTGGIGEIIESPIVANFREGLSVLEYFISTHGARKGLADTALKTSEAGYLTRRLVDAAQDLIITEDDCGTSNYIEVEAIKEITPQGERELETLEERITGRYTAEDVKHPLTGRIIVEKNGEITEELATEIMEAGIPVVPIRSVLTCDTRRGICVKCYGRNMATRRMVTLGEAIGIVAAQSIGEPGTQLTLRTFHIGGTASRQLEGWYQSKEDSIARFKGSLKILELEDGTGLAINRTGAIHLESEDGAVQILPNIPYGANVLIKNGDKVIKGQRIVNWNPHHTPIISEVTGTVDFEDLRIGSTLREEMDQVTGVKVRIVSEHKEELHPQLLIKTGEEIVAQYALSSGTIINQDVKKGMKVKAGDVLARIPREQSKSRDITGGLPRIEELFEARKPKDSGIIADIDGTVHLKGISKGTRKIGITSDGGEEKLYNVPLSRHLIVQDGEKVKSGEQITDGSVNPHDILRIKGDKAVQQFLLAEVQHVYRMQGVGINDKHIESIVKQMLKKVVINEVGNTKFLFGQQVDKFDFNEENRKTMEKGGEPAKASPKLLGLTKASLETDSFISAASFQETTRVLTDAAVRGRCDYLHGLKENVIMGLLIPAGTGLPRYKALEVVEVDPPVVEEVEEETVSKV